MALPLYALRSENIPLFNKKVPCFTTEELTVKYY